VLCILTTDYKKRVWTRSRVGVLSEFTPVYLHDPEQNCSGVVVINWRVMLNRLVLIEHLLDVGFKKPVIQRSLLVDLKTAQRVGLKQVIDWENLLVGMRPQAEYQFAYIISQRT
jgi:hypothetical protein